MTRRMLSVLLMVCIWLTMLLPVVHAEESVPAEPVPVDPVADEDVPTAPVVTGPAAVVNCHIMTREWFGTKGGTSLLGDAVGTELTECLSNYFLIREDSYKHGVAVRAAVSAMGNCSSQVRQEAQVRANAVALLEALAGIEITDAKVTVRYGEDGYIVNGDNTITVFLYEWTFFDYDDLSDDVAATDLSGYGIYHKITLEQVGDSFTIVLDEYDESDFLGVCTITQASVDEMLAMNYEPQELVDTSLFAPVKRSDYEVAAASGGWEMYAGYDPDKVVEYADKYVSHSATGGNVDKGFYNSVYHNYNDMGGDCANYTSQCIAAGGMPQVKCAPTARDGWYYVDRDDRSGTWTGAGYLREWMASNRGIKKTADPSTLLKGSPVFYTRDASIVQHATICVGRNSAGTPIINSHNKDVYHGIWNYWGAGAIYTTVQLTPETQNPEIEKHLGIDVSDALGLIDWEKAKPHIEFATIRCGFGANKMANDDARWDRNASECARLGIPFYARFFSTATTEAEARSEADRALRQLKDHPEVLGIYLELEDPDMRAACTAEQIRKHATIFAETLEAAGYQVGIFSNLSCWNSILTAEDYDKWDRWIAYWPKDGVTPPNYSKNYTIWQFTNQGSVPGISGNVRLNYRYGSLDAAMAVDRTYPTPFKAYTLLWKNTDTGKIPVYASVGDTTPGGYICNGYNGMDDECTIEEVYKNGWCKVTVPGLSGLYYCKLSVFLNIEQGYTPRKIVASEYIGCYRRWNHESPRGNIDAGDSVLIVSETDTMFQAIYPTSTIMRCRWIDKNALTHSYATETVTPTCTAQGYKIYTCTVCGYRYIDSYTNAKGHTYCYQDKGNEHTARCTVCSYSMTEFHSYSEYTCVCGAVETLPPILNEKIVISHSISLGSDISMNYVVRADLLSDYDSYYLEVQVPVYSGNELTGAKTLRIEPEQKGSNYYFVMTDLMAINMNDVLEATLHMYKGRQEYVSKPDNYSVAVYAIGLLNMDGVAQERKTLCADLLRYGATAQLYKGYRTDALATEAMTAGHKAYLSDLSKVTFGNTNTVFDDMTTPIITWAGKTLSLGSKVVVKFVFYAGAFTGDISKLTLRMVYQGMDGAYRTVTLSDPTVYNAANRAYAFEFGDLTAAELRTAVSVAVYNGDVQLSKTLQYSADTYGNNQSGALLELCKALFAYSDSAKAYFAK